MKKEETKKEKLEKRIIEIDFLRGIAVFLMILDHFMYDLWGLLPMIFEDFPKRDTFFFDLVKFAEFYWDWPVRIVVRYFILFIFLGLTGICCSFSKSNLKRGGKLMAVAILLTFATFIIGKMIDDPDLMITFGVLHCIALTLIIIGLLEKWIHNKWIYLVIGVIMVAIGIYLEPRAVVISYGKENLLLLIFKQIIGVANCGSDCFPLFLNGGQIFIGVFLGKLIYSSKQSLFKKLHYSNNVVTFIGRNSLIVYFAHQIILPLLAGIILLILGYHLYL